MRTRVHKWLSGLWVNRRKSRTDFPYPLTGDAEAEIPLLATYQASVVVMAEGPGQAAIYVTDEWIRADEFKALESRLTRTGWTYSIKTESSAVIRSKYGHGDSTHRQNNSVEDKKTVNNAHFDEILSVAAQKNAREIRFHVRQEGCGIVHNIDGLVYPYQSISSQFGIDLCSNAFTNLADPTSYDQDKTSFSESIDQSCTIMRSVNGELYKLRYTSLPEADGGFDVTMRLLPQGKKGDVPSLEALGHSPSAIAVLKRAMARRLGGIYATGPVGSGKTSTLYALLWKPAHDRSEYVITYEDPPEYFQYGITRVPVARIGYEAAVEKTLRMGAHKVMIGEIRTSKMAYLAKILSETGHKVVTTLHVNGAHKVIDRLCGDELHLPRQIMCDRDMVSIFFYQRLLPKLHDCKLPATPELLGERIAANLQRLGIPLDGVRVHKPGGCSLCNNGRKGSIPIVEVIEPDDTYLRLMRENRDGDAKDYWFSTCKTGLLDEDITGKPIMATALYRVSIGELDPIDLEKEIDLLDGFTPYYASATPALKVASL